jgi:hypothetical protein
MANELSLDNVGGIFVVLVAGMGIACSIAVIEYILKSRRLEKKINIRHSDLVKKAITQTNLNMFYINRNSLDINGRGTIHTDHCHSQVQIYGTRLNWVSSSQNIKFTIFYLRNCFYPADGQSRALV